MVSMGIEALRAGERHSPIHHGRWFRLALRLFERANVIHPYTKPIHLSAYPLADMASGSAGRVPPAPTPTLVVTMGVYPLRRGEGHPPLRKYSTHTGNHSSFIILSLAAMDNWELTKRFNDERHNMS